MCPSYNCGISEWPLFKTAHVVKNIWRITNTIASIWRQNMLGYFPWTLSTLESSQFTSSYVFRKVFASRNRSFPRTNIRTYFRAKWSRAIDNLYNHILTSEANDSLFFSPPEIPRNRPGIPMYVSAHLVRPSFKTKVSFCEPITATKTKQRQKMWLFHAPYLEHYLLDTSYPLVIRNVFFHAQESLEKPKSKVFMALKWNWNKGVIGLFDPIKGCKMHTL